MKWKCSECGWEATTIDKKYEEERQEPICIPYAFNKNKYFLMQKINNSEVL